MLNRDMVKAAVLGVCASKGLTIEQTERKVAAAIQRLKLVEANAFLDTAKWMGGQVADAGKLIGTSVVLPAAGYAAGGAMLAPIAAGGLGGYLLGRGGRVHDEDIHEERQRELVEAYRDAARRVDENRRRAVRHATPKPRGRSLV